MCLYSSGLTNTADGKPKKRKSHCRLQIAHAFRRFVAKPPFAFAAVPGLHEVFPFRTAVSFWGTKLLKNLTGLSPKWDCGSKRLPLLLLAPKSLAYYRNAYFTTETACVQHIALCTPLYHQNPLLLAYTAVLLFRVPEPHACMLAYRTTFLIGQVYVFVCDKRP